MTDAKTCPICEREFTRAPGCSRWNFDRRTYCSMACRNRAAVLHRRKAGCPITTGRGRCSQPVTRWGWCERHAADHARLCPGGCERCGSEPAERYPCGCVRYGDRWVPEGCAMHERGGLLC